jgi:hypothetical protein
VARAVLSPALALAGRSDDDAQVAAAVRLLVKLVSVFVALKSGSTLHLLRGSDHGYHVILCSLHLPPTGTALVLPTEPPGVGHRGRPPPPLCLPTACTLLDLPPLSPAVT